MEIVDRHQAETQLAQLIRRALAGESIVIAESGKPLVELKPYVASKPRVGGQWLGRLRMADDFDAPQCESNVPVYGDDDLS